MCGNALRLLLCGPYQAPTLSSPLFAGPAANIAVGHGLEARPLGVCCRFLQAGGQDWWDALPWTSGHRARLGSSCRRHGDAAVAGRGLGPAWRTARRQRGWVAGRGNCKRRRGVVFPARESSRSCGVVVVPIVHETVAGPDEHVASLTDDSDVWRLDFIAYMLSVVFAVARYEG